MIRAGTEEDAEVIVGLFNKEVNITGNIYEYDKNCVLEYLNNPMCKLFVYELDNKVVGVITASFWSIAKWIYIEEISVDKEYRRRGIATELVNYIENLSDGKEIFLVVDKDNRSMKKLMKKKEYTKGKKYIYYTK